MSKKILDTNILIRFLTNDTPQLARQSEAIFAKAQKNELIIPDLVFAEIVFVLMSFYKLEKQEVVEKLRVVIEFEKFNTNEQLLNTTLNIFEENNISFIDAYLLANLQRNPDYELISFDKRLMKLKEKLK